MVDTLQIAVDVEELLIQGLLRPNAAISAVFGTKVHSRIPIEPAYPLVRVRRLGGSLTTSRHLWLDRARVQIDVYGDTKKATWRAANTVRSLLIAAQCTTYAPHGRVDGITETIAPFELDDPDSSHIHFVSEYLILVRPLAVTT